jgi:hypothetical protein
MEVKKIILIGFSLRLFIAFWNGFFGPSPGADLDAFGLNGFAENVARSGEFESFSVGYKPYTNILGLIYGVTISHIFVGSIISCFAWLYSAVLISQCLKLMVIQRTLQRRAMWIYTLLPSSIMLTAVTLREPYQLLFINLAIYAVLRIFINNRRWYWVVLFFSIAGFGSLHGALFAFGLLLFAGSLLLVNMKNHGKKMPNIFIPFILIFILVFLILGFKMFNELSYSLDGGLDQAVEAYQQGSLGVDARTNYKTEVSISGMGELFIFIPLSLIQYLFEPFPWRVSSASDLLVLFENILRAWLIWRSIKNIKIASHKNIILWKFIFACYIIIEVIWSLGTINWGTAVRHHIPALGLLLLAAFATPAGKLNK